MLLKYQIYRDLIKMLGDSVLQKKLKLRTFL